MLNGITYPSIKPLSMYSANEQSESHTTLTQFSDVLKSEENKTKAIQTAENETDNDEIIYTNPKTGDVFRLKEAKKSTTNTTSVNASASQTLKTSKNTSASTTSATSMKETKYDEYFKEAAQKYDVSESLLKAIAKAESNFNPNDVSSAGAIGIMQLMPETAKELGVSDPYDPKENILGGAKCISQKLKEFNGDLELALAAYNAGSGAVKRNGGVPSYCKSYISKVLSYKEAFETAAAV